MSCVASRVNQDVNALGADVFRLLLGAEAREMHKLVYVTFHPLCNMVALGEEVKGVHLKLASVQLRQQPFREVHDGMGAKVGR